MGLGQELEALYNNTMILYGTHDLTLKACQTSSDVTLCTIWYQYTNIKQDGTIHNLCGHAHQPSLFI